MKSRIARWAWLGLALTVACASDSEEPTLDGAVAPAASSPGGNQTQSDGGPVAAAPGVTDPAPLPDAGALPPNPGLPGGAGLPGSGLPAGSTTGGTGATPGGAGTADAGVVMPVPAGPNCLKGSGNYTAMGPYKIKKTSATIGSSGPYTIFAPDPLEASCPHPVVAWGNGTGVSDGTTYAFYQEHAASWGIVVVASHESNAGSGAFHKAGLDYMYEQSKTQGSPFFGKLSPRAGTSGHSQGGGGANAGASHPNVTTIVNVQGAFGTAPRGKNFLCLTGTADISPMGCKTSVDGANAPAFLANYEGADHTGTATLLGFITGDAGTKQYMRLYSAWFRCFLADDQGACAMFKGGMSCPLCKEMGWNTIYAKNY